MFIHLQFERKNTKYKKSLFNYRCIQYWLYFGDLLLPKIHSVAVLADFSTVINSFDIGDEEEQDLRDVRVQ